MTTHKNDPRVVRNGYTNRYQVDLRLEIDPEIFNRLFLEELKSSPDADLMNPDTTERVREKLGRSSFWMNRVDQQLVTLKPIPGNTIPLGPAPLLPPSPTTPSRPTEETVSVLPEKFQHLDKYHPSRSGFEQIYRELSEQARSVAPYRWFETFQSALPPGPKNKDKQDIYNMRSAQKTVLIYLLDEWRDGRYQLTPEAAEEQRQEEARQQGQFVERVEAVAAAVNGNKLK